MAARTRRTQSSDEGCDRFSALPDAIIHHIFSFLGPNDTVRISVLSRRCRQLSISSPYLCFMSPKFFECTTRCKNFRNFLDRILDQRDGQSIDRLLLCWSCAEPNCHILGPRLDSWANRAVICNVVELDLQITLTTNEVFELLSCISRCSSLKGFKLRLRYYCPLKLPSVGFVSLETLTLKVVKIRNALFGEWLSESCPSLKSLTLWYIAGRVRNLNITNSSLEYLNIIQLHAENYFHHISISSVSLRSLLIELDVRFPSRASAKIIAPNLQYLKWKACPLEKICFGNFKSLQEADIVCDRFHLYPNLSVNFMLELLSRGSSVRNSSLQGKVIKILFDNGCLPITLHNLQHLHLVVTASISYIPVPAMAAFLNGFPNLKNLIIKLGKCFDPDDGRENSDKEENGESQNLPISFQLNEIEIHLNGKWNIIGLVKYLLGHAKGLEKMKIFYARLLSDMLSHLDIQNLERASSTAQVFFIPKEIDGD